MNPGELEQSIPDAAYEAGERAALPYVAEVDALDVASDVLHAAELRRLADELEVVAGEMREMDPDPGRWTGLAEGIRHLRARADRYDGGAA